MSYQTQATLEYDPDFRERNRACCVQQATTQNDSVSDSVLKNDPSVIGAFIALAAAGPGIADKAELADGTVDQSRILDADILALTQANWPTVAGLFPA